MAAAATATKPAPARARTAPARKPAPVRKPARKPAPARKRSRKPAQARAVAPARRTTPARRTAPTRRPGAQLIPIAVGTATAVGRLPDSNLMVRMTRGRVWIGVLGALLAGIVALNVITLSLAATAGRVDQNIQALDKENSILRSRDAHKSGAARVRSDAAAIGLTVPTSDDVGLVEVSPHDAATAAQRLDAAGTGY